MKNYNVKHLKSTLLLISVLLFYSCNKIHPDLKNINFESYLGKEVYTLFQENNLLYEEYILFDNITIIEGVFVRQLTSCAFINDDYRVLIKYGQLMYY